MSHLTATTQSPQPTPLSANAPAWVPTASALSATTAATPGRLPVLATPIDAAHSNASNSSRLPTTVKALFGQRRSLQSLSNSLNKLHQPDQLNFHNLKVAMGQTRRLKGLLQSSVGTHDSLTNKALSQAKTELLAALERVALNLDQIALTDAVEDVKTVFDGFGALFSSDATTTIFEDAEDKRVALQHLQTIHARLLEHTPRLDLGSARPSAVLSIVNAIPRCWKLGAIAPFDPKASALIVSLPAIARTWTEDKLTLKDLGKCFVQLSAAMAYATVTPASDEGQAIRAIFNQLANSLGKLSGYKGVTDVDDETVAVCIGNIGWAFTNAVVHGYFEPADIDAAQDLFKTQLEFIAQSTHASARTRAIALQALEHLERLGVARAEPSGHEDDSFSDADVDEAEVEVEPMTTPTSTQTSTSTATATTTTTSTTSLTRTTTTTAAFATRPASTSRAEQERRLQSLKTSTPRTILETIYQNGNFDVLFDSVNAAGDSGLKVLFGLGKVKELEAIAGFNLFLQFIWDVDGERFGQSIDTLADAVPSLKNPTAQRPWLETLQHTFDRADPIHARIGALLDRLDAAAQSRTSEANTEQTRLRRRTKEIASAGPKDPVQPSLLPLTAGEMKRLDLADKDHLKRFFERAVAAYATDADGGYVPNDVRALRIPMLQPDDNGEHDIKVSDLIEQYRSARGVDRTQLEAQWTDMFERRGVAGRMRAARPQDTPRAPTPKLSAQPVRPKPLPTLGDLPAPSRFGAVRPSDAAWFLAHGLFGAALYQALLGFTQGHVFVKGPLDVQAHIEHLSAAQALTRNADSLNRIDDPDGALRLSAHIFEAYLRELQRLGNVVPLSEGDNVRPTWPDIVALLSALGLAAIGLYHYRKQ